MTESPWHPRSVLVIDDDPLMRELLVALLEVEGISVAAAASGEEALTRLTGKEMAWEVILTDLRMPDTEVTQLAPRLRATCWPGALLLGMSGSPAEPEELALLDGFLLKPFSTEEFLAAVGMAQLGDAGKAAAASHSDVTTAGSGSEDAPPVLDMKVYDKMALSLKPAALSELYRITLDDVRQRAATIKAAYSRGDHETCRREAHAIKGGCGMVGAMELRAEATALEAGAPANTLAMAGLEQACERLQGMLDALPVVTLVQN